MVNKRISYRDIAFIEVKYIISYSFRIDSKCIDCKYCVLQEISVLKTSLKDFLFRFHYFLSKRGARAPETAHKSIKKHGKKILLYQQSHLLK